MRIIWPVTLRLLCLIFLSACMATADATPTAAQDNVSPTQTPSAAQTAIPTQDRSLRTVPTSFATNTAPVPQTIYACEPATEGSNRQYTVVINADYAAKSAEVVQRVTYHNDTGSPLMDLGLAIEANAYGIFSMGGIFFDGDSLDYTLNSNQLSVNLPQALPARCSITFDMQFSVQLRPIAVDNAYKGYMGYSERQMNLGHWLPSVAPRRAEGWLIHDVYQIGEQTVLEQADWDVIIQVNNARDSVKVAAPGTMTQLDSNRWRFSLKGGRDFAISIGEDYRVHTATTESGKQIEVYTFADATVPGDRGLLDGAQHALEQAERAFQQYEALFGPYPYDRMVIVQGDFADGMEFTGLVYVGTCWFYTFTGGARNYLTLITVHELSHQWWYAKVGNDAANAPWLDESLATYSEYIFLSEFYPADKDWWWDFRVNTYFPMGNVDSSVYAFSDFRTYINAVYLRGVLLLQALREEMGTEAFFAWIKDYAQSGQALIATPELLWSRMPADSYEQTAEIRRQFFAEPDVLPQSTDGESFEETFTGP